MNKNNEENRKQVKSVILDSELKEWEEWGNRYFGDGTEYEDQTYHESDRKNKRK